MKGRASSFPESASRQGLTSLPKKFSPSLEKVHRLGGWVRIQSSTDQTCCGRVLERQLARGVLTETIWTVSRIAEERALP